MNEEIKITTFLKDGSTPTQALMGVGMIGLVTIGIALYWIRD